MTGFGTCTWLYPSHWDMKRGPLGASRKGAVTPKEEAIVPLICLVVTPGRRATLEDTGVSRITACAIRAWHSVWSLPNSGLLMVGINTLLYYLSLFEACFGVILREKHCNQFLSMFPLTLGKKPGYIVQAPISYMNSYQILDFILCVLHLQCGRMMAQPQSRF